MAAPIAAQQQVAPGFTPELSTSGIVRAPDGTLFADGHSHRARFSNAGARIEVAHPDDNGASVAATFRLVDHGRPGHVVAVAQGQPTQSGADILRYDHGSVFERYRVGERGFEQSFVLQQRPAGNGDYVLGIAVAGAGIELPVLEAAHQSVSVLYQGRPSVRYGEAVVFERGGRRVPIATRSDGAGRIELIVPSKYLDNAQYPIVVDPAVGPVLLPAGSFYSDSQPDVAQNPDNGNFMFVWHRQTNQTSEIYGRIYTRSGAAVTPITVLTYISGGGPYANPSVCGVRGFTVVYESGDNIRIREFYSTHLGWQAPERSVSTPPSGQRDRRPRISGDGTNGALVVFDRTAAGASQPNEIRAVSLYWAGAIVNWSGGASVVLESVTSGFVRRPRIPRTAAYHADQQQAWVRNRVVWERFYASPAPGDYDVRTAVIRGYQTTLEVLSSAATVVGAGIPSNEYRADIAVHADYWTDPDPLFLIAWEKDNDVKAHLYSLTAPMGSEIDIQSTSDVETSPAVGAGTTEFTVGYLQAVPPNELSLNVRAARVLFDGSVPISDREVDVLNGPYQSRLELSSLPPKTPSSERRNTTMFAWHGATGPSTGIDDVRARLFEPVASNTSPFGSACPGPQGEMPFVDTIGQPTPGNSAFQITIDNAPVNSLAALIIGDVLASNPLPGAPGCDLYMGLPLLNAFPVVTSPNGYGTVNIPIPAAVPSGVVLAFQWGVYTPGHNAFGWITSNDLDVAWSHL